MRIWLLVILIGCSSLLNSQSNKSPTLLIILGKYSYQTAAIGYIIGVTFIEDPTKCDPVKGFVPLEDQIKHFSESLVALGLPANCMQPVKSYESSPMRKQKMEIRYSDWEKLSDISTVFHQYNLEPTELLYAFTPKKYEDEDDWAVGSFQDARATAEILAGYLGQKIKRVVNVDDDTQSVSIFAERRDTPSSYEMAEFLSKFESMSYSDVRESTYALRVTFELE